MVDSNGTLKKSTSGSESDYMGFNRRKTTRDSHQKYFVLDANLFLLAVPDKAQLQCGKLLCVSSLFNTIARVERASTRQLAVYFCSEEAVGLTEKVDPRSLSPDLARQIVPNTRRANCSWWKLTLLFESEAMCKVACQHIQRQHSAHRDAKLREMAALIEGVFAA